MPKTRRKKINQKAPLRTSKNITLLLAGGDQINTKLGRAIFVQRLTGENKGKNYPYASTKRGGRPLADLRVAPRVAVGFTAASS